MQQGTVDRIAIIIVDGSQSRNLTQALNDRGFPVTLLDAVGGFLHEAMVTLMVGLSHSRLPQFFEQVREHCPGRTRYMSMGAEGSMMPGFPMMIETRLGGATVFVLPVERFIQL